MGLTNIIKRICQSLGESNKPFYPMVAIAAANGICRPTFTMLKKGEDPQSKKYAALREGLTEVIAVPTYIASGIFAEKCGGWIASKAADKEITKLQNAGQTLTQEVQETLKKLKVSKGKSGLSLIGTLIAAGLIIPSLCTVVVTPIMDKIKKNSKPLDVKEPQITPVKQPIKYDNFTTIKRPVFNNMSFGMKVGGV